MNNEVFQQALENISEPMIEEAAQVYDRAGLKRRKTRNILRIAAIAAVLALLLTALLWPGNDQNVSPYFSVYVYANETDTTELQMNESTLSNMLCFNSNIGVTEPTKPSFGVDVKLNDLTRDFQDLAILCNGKEIEQHFCGIFVSYVETTGTSIKDDLSPHALRIAGTVDEPTTISLILYENDKILQEYVFQVEPVKEGFNITLIENCIKPAR